MIALPALFRLFSGPCREISCTALPRAPLPRKLIKRRKSSYYRSHYGCYSAPLTSTQKIKRVMSFALVIAVCLAVTPSFAATKKKQQSWQAQCQKSDKGLAECCAEKEAECKGKGTDEQTCSDRLHACTTVEVSSFSSGSLKKTKSSTGVSTVQAKLKAAKIKSAKK